MTTEQKNFIKTVGTLARADMQKSKILASLTIAQAILESGWGKSGLTVKANALFGIKANRWTGKVYSCATKECYDGKTYTNTTACFRAYGSWAESVADHSAFLCGLRRYRAVIGETNYKKACRAIKAAGYATAPNYAESLISLIEEYRLTDYDTVQTTAPARWDYQYDPAIAELQRILSTKGAKLAIDGKAGENTLAACKKYTIEKGDRGPLTKWVQQRINSLGYSCGTADGIAGKNTMAGIAAFQKANSLGIGYLGGEDWYYLIR